MLLIVWLFKIFLKMVENCRKVITLYAELQEFILLTGSVRLLG